MTQRETIAELKKIIARAVLLIEDIERDDARLSREDYEAGKAKFYIGQKVKIVAPDFPNYHGQITKIVKSAFPAPIEIGEWLVADPVNVGMATHVKESQLEEVIEATDNDAP